MKTAWLLMSAFGDTGHELEFLSYDEHEARSKFEKAAEGILGEPFTDEAWDEYINYTDTDQLWLMAVELPEVE